MSRPDTDSAHSVRGIPPSEILTPYPSIRSLLNSQVRRYGDRTFLIAYSADGSRHQVSYLDFSRKVFQGANYLKNRGVNFGDRIPVTGSHGFSSLLEIFAIWTLGGVAVLKADSGEEKENSAEFLDIIGEFDPEFQIGKKSRISDDVLLVYSRTHKGKTEGIRLSHYNLLVEAMAVAERQELGDASVVVCGLSVTDTTGIAGCVLPTLYGGGTAVVPAALSGDSLVDLIGRERASVAFVSRSFLSFVLESGEAFHDSLLSLDHFTTAIHDPGLESIFSFTKSQDTPVLTGLALPEATAFASLVPLLRKDGALLMWPERQEGIPAGKALHATEMGILDERGNDRGENERGEIVIRGHSVMKEYLDNERATKKAFTFGWLHSGVEGFYRVGGDGDKYFFITV